LLGRKPGFAATIVVTLSLGLGLNAAFFTIFNSFLLRPLAVRDPASLMSIEWQTRYKTDVAVSWQEFVSASKAATGFEGMAACTLESTGLDGRAAKMALVSSNYFTLLGARIGMGRPFETDERGAVAVLSHRVWQGRYASDPQIIGRMVQVSGVPFEVIGVAAAEFAGVAVGYAEFVTKDVARMGIVAPDLWVPFESWTAMRNLPQYGVRGMIGRLGPGASEARADAMMTAFARRATEGKPAYDRASRVVLETLEIPVTWTALQYSLPLLIAFGLTMLIPCANAANLMLARAMARQREFGARLSLGASRGRIVRQLLTESLVLAVAAGAAGLAVAHLALHYFARSLYKTAPPTLLYKVRIPDFEIDGHVFFYMLLMAVITTALFSLAPAAQATRVAVSFALRGEYGVFRASRLRDGLVVAQVSACVMLLAVASVMLRGTARSTKIPRGFEASGVFGVVNQSPESARALSAILEAESWVEGQAVMGAPLNEMKTLQVANASRPGWETMYFHNSSGEFFDIVRIPIVKGRTFTREESESLAAVAVINESAARKLWPGEEALGKSISLDPGSSSSLRIPKFREARVVGISRDIVAKLKDGGARPTVHFPDRLRNGTVLIVRGKGTPDQTASKLEASLLRAPGSLTGARVVNLRETIEWETYPQGALAWLSSILGSVALLLTVTGVYGVMSYMVSQRTKEIGIRMALGATPLRIARFILFYSTRLAGIGLLFGMVLAIGVMQYCASKMELAVNFFDIPAYLLGLGVVSLAALFAAAGPARRARAVDPQDAVRSDG
jgi:predicted permease